MRFINLTPHAITFQYADGRQEVFPPSGSVCRVDEEIVPLPPIGGMPVVMKRYSGVALPAPEAGTIYIVSTMVANALTALWLSEDYQVTGARRTDLVAPATGPNDGAVRKDGQIVAVTKWQVP